MIGAPKGCPASAKDGPGQGQTARQPLWSMARWPNISKYCVWCRVSASGSSKVWAKLTPCSGDWVTPRMVAGGSSPSASRTVGTMSMMCAYWLADLAAGRDAGWPVHQERVARAAAVGLALPAAERRVAGPGPAPRVVVEGVGPAELVDLGQAVLQRLRGVVEELRLVGGAGRPALGARPVVGDHHDQGVVQLAGLAQEVQQPADRGVGVGQEPREHLHHPGGQPAGLAGTATPTRGRRDRGGRAPRRPG